jgi:hypothetical protein
MQTAHGFGGSLVATTDEDWEKKWNTPAEPTRGLEYWKRLHDVNMPSERFSRRKLLPTT